MFNLFDRATRALVHAGYWIAVLAALLLMIIGGVDVVLNLFSRSLPAALEMQEVLLALLVFLGLAHVQRRRENISVDIVLERLGKNTRRVLELLGLLCSAGIFAIVAWRSGALALDSLLIRESASALWQFPIYPVKVLVSIGAGLATLECLRQIGWWFKGQDARDIPSAELEKM